MADITFDQLIADLCVVRGKNPQIGTWKLENAKVVGDNFYLDITDGEKSFTFAIEMPDVDRTSNKCKGCQCHTEDGRCLYYCGCAYHKQK